MCLITNLINLNKIFISSDHAGFKLKQSIIRYLSNNNMNYQDLGPYTKSRVDYPDYAHKVAKKVKINKNNMGICNLGSGSRCQLKVDLGSFNNILTLPNLYFEERTSNTSLK